MFFDSGFFLSHDATDLIKKLQLLPDDGIEPAPYHLQELKEAVKVIEKLRARIECSSPHRHAWLQGTHTLANGSAEQSGHQCSPFLAPTFEEPKFAPAIDLQAEVREIFSVASRLDIKLLECLIRYAKEMNPFSGTEVAKALSGNITVTELIERVEPASHSYAALRKALKKYQQLCAERGPKSMHSAKLQMGSHGSDVKRLQQRLSEEAFYTGQPSSIFDKSTREAVQSFQRSHQLNPDGVVGTQTLDRLNEPYVKKLEMVQYSLRALRHSQTRRYERFIRINIPEFVLEYHTDGETKETYRIIVGKAVDAQATLRGKSSRINQTPTLVSAVKQVILNPRWYVPDRIRMELNDNLKSDPNYLVRNGYVAMSKSYPWGAPRLFQRPGPKNPLGQVKFEFPNRYGVYLHDTPQRHLFGLARRDFSHGCIRVDRALDFAQLLLVDDENPESAGIEEYLKKNRQFFITLRHPVPLIIEYIPVSANEEEKPVFLGDPYGLLAGNRANRS